MGNKLPSRFLVDIETLFKMIKYGHLCIDDVSSFRYYHETGAPYITVDINDINDIIDNRTFMVEYKKELDLWQFEEANLSK